MDAITTIDNKEIVMDKVIKSLPFRRNWLSQHDMVIDSRQKIIRNYEKLKSAHTFFYFIAKVFEHISHQETLREIINYLE